MMGKKPGAARLDPELLARGPSVAMYVWGPLDGASDDLDSAPARIWHGVRWGDGERRHAYQRGRLRAVTADGRAWWRYVHAGSVDQPLDLK